MPFEHSSDVKFEIGHVLFIDIVGYSKLLITEQSHQIQKLGEIICATEQSCLAEAAGKLLRLPTGDGAALVFRSSPEAAVLCALEVAEGLKDCPELQVRMGIHSGPVNEITDLNKQANIAGAGINMAQRVMDCADAGHILLSKRIADDLEQYPQWRSILHELGECEVKHGTRVHAVNLYTDKVGNPERPWRFREQTRDTAPESEPPRKSIAVLPFENLSEDKANAYFADGIQEEILTRLSKIADLKVTSRTSTQRFKGSTENLPQIASQLGVTTILEGTVQKVGDQVRVTVQLIDAELDTHLWAERYDRKLTDIFAVESDIAANIAEALQARLTGAERRAIASQPTKNSGAHQLYLKGRFCWNQRTPDALKTSLHYFEQAIEKDSKYALAYAGLADVYCSLGFSFDAGALSPGDAVPKARAAARKALQIDETLAEAHTSLAFIKLNYDWDWPGAETEFKRALELNPNYDNARHWYSHYLTSLQRTGESLVESKRALELDQLGLIMNVHLGWHYLYARQPDLAIDQLRKTLELDPNYGLTHWYLGLAHAQKSSYADAVTELRISRRLLPDNVGVQADIGYVHAVSGQKRQAHKLISDLSKLSKKKYVSSYHTALIYVGLRENDHAFEWLEKAYGERSDSLVYLAVEPRLDPVRGDPHFEDLLRRVGLDQLRREDRRSV
jgi:TolB-like protein/Tfp pilus assembly protein PilF/class 3 adenylate cyclase